jgi:hypothetical protein
MLVLSAALATTGCDCGNDPPGGSGGGAGGGAGGGVGGGAGGGGGGNGMDASVAEPQDVHVVITSDNAYGFGYGSPESMRVYFNGLEAVGSDDIFICSEACEPGPDAGSACAVGACDAFGSCNEDGLGPETYIVPGSDTNAGDFLYVIAWSDDYVTQGLLGQFAAADGSNVIYTGNEEWEVCATGVDYDIGSGGPTTTVIDEWIAKCNQGAAGGSFSGGWLGVDGRDDMALVVGDANVAGGGDDFQDTCSDDTKGDHIPDDAHWMWFDDDVDNPPDAFHSTGGSANTQVNPHEFFIFRLGVEEIIIVPL